MALTAAGLLEPAAGRLRVVPPRTARRRLLAHPVPRAASSRTPTATATSAPTSPPACGITCWSPATTDSPQRMWPTVRAAIDFVLGPAGRPAVKSVGPEAPSGPLAGGAADRLASIYHSIRCALALADHLGEPQPEWEVAVGRLGHAIVAHPEAFTEKPHHSMDWYYPILGGALRGPAADRANRRSAGTTSWSTAWASAASTTGPGSPAPRPANWCWHSTRWATGDRRSSSSPPCSTCASATAPTGRAWCSPTASAGRWSAPPGPARR